MPTTSAVRGPGPVPVHVTQPPPPTMDRYRHLNEAQRILLPIFKPMWTPNKQYLTDEDLAQLNVRVSPLDITTGRVAGSDGGDQFIRPRSLHLIEQALTAIKPWRTEPQRGLQLDMGLPNHWKARYLSDYLNLLIDECPPGKSSLMDQTGWEHEESGSTYALVRIDYKTGVNFTVENLYGPSDPSVPHLTAILIDDAALRDGVVSAAEFWCIMYLTFRRYFTKEYMHHKIIPITLVSASEYKARIAQGFVDLQARRVNVRLSKIFDLTEGESKNWTEVKTILSWMLGDPVGRTT
ncbi:hypothetical protein F4778DRAFT_521046 [Xylariomycetidae sp. FL2044]|nr:hypothetical protein F4778DRAFT_521046 [Xylariomycetidae sp. FL2044]